jgi:hypothetical protein
MGMAATAVFVRAQAVATQVWRCACVLAMQDSVPYSGHWQIYWQWGDACESMRIAELQPVFDE